MRAVNADGIEAAIGWLRVVALQIGKRGFADFRLFRRGDAGSGADLAAGFAAAHFDEYQDRAIAGDEVDFAVTAADVVRYNGKPLRLEIAGGAAFARLAAHEMRREFFEDEHEVF